MSWSGGDWMCGACQHLNFKKRDTCQRCGYPKFGGPDPSTYGYNKTEVLAGDWYCTAMNCGAHNYASRSSCYRCGAYKNDYAGMTGSGAYVSDASAPPGWKTGDWMCTSVGCGVHNYASRTECFRCKTPRAFGKKLYNRLSVSLFLHTKSLTTSSVLYTFYNMVSFV
ncbi:Zinc finger Ran-binding domain-containing protein 2 [Morella rubra]|uniref:Zinc finger Ran-binding domain-containing protein 2 n=1 Tax=Morella rubra TaxID=262757 RepID=A0A6A1WKL4_9ROSI|nr:Zinc finger Ran-binding domain-containing protein 2 [Morella rubra]